MKRPPMKRWAFANKYIKFSPLWALEVEKRLRDGYGVDDIALWMDCPRDWIAAQIGHFRALGLLAQWWPSHVH